MLPIFWEISQCYQIFFEQTKAKAVQMKILSTFEDSYIFEYNLVGDRSNVQRGRVTREVD